MPKIIFYITNDADAQAGSFIPGKLIFLLVFSSSPPAPAFDAGSFSIDGAMRVNYVIDDYVDELDRSSRAGDPAFNPAPGWSSNRLGVNPEDHWEYRFNINFGYYF